MQKETKFTKNDIQQLNKQNYKQLLTEINHLLKTQIYDHKLVKDLAKISLDHNCIHELLEDKAKLKRDFYHIQNHDQFQSVSKQLYQRIDQIM